MSKRSSGPWVKELNENLWADELYGEVEQPEADEAPAASRSRTKKLPSSQTRQASSNARADPVASMAQQPPTTAVNGLRSDQETNPFAKLETSARDAAPGSGNRNSVITWGDIAISKQNNEYSNRAVSALSSTVLARADDPSPGSGLLQANMIPAGAIHTNDVSRSQFATPSSSQSSNDFWGSPLVAGLLHSSAARRSEVASSLPNTLATANHASFEVTPEGGKSSHVNSSQTSLNDFIPYSSEASSIHGHVSQVSMLDPGTVESLRLLQQREAANVQLDYSSSTLSGLGRSLQNYGGLPSTVSQSDLERLSRGHSWEAQRASQNPYLGST